MANLLNLLQKNPLTLIVNLPENSLDHALAAMECGADAVSLKVASLDAYLEQKTEILRIIKKMDVPVGVLLDSVKSFNVAELNELVSAGVDFIGVSMRQIPKALANKKGIAEVYVLDAEYTIDEIMNIEKREGVILEAKVVRHGEVGKDLNVGDLQNYITMATSTDLPIIVQTQKRIHPSEIPILWDTGVKGLELTAPVLGDSVKSLQKAVRDFRIAIDDLGE